MNSTMSESRDEEMDMPLLKSELVESPPLIALSNQRILSITCALFAIFVVAEIVGALASGSLSLLGDAAAMSVDVFTYFTNMYAEWVKSKGRNIDERTRFMLEVYIPSFSVCALVGVTIYITSEAVDVIMSGDDDDDVDVYFLYGFAIGNFLVDVASSGLFYMKGKEALLVQAHAFSIDGQDPGTMIHKQKANLNMVSALTHVGGDTLRTLSVFIAAVVATATTVSSGLCDAWAAVAVSVTIIVAIIPLVSEIYKAATHTH